MGIEGDHRRAIRQHYSPQNLADQQMRLRRGELLAHDPLVNSQAKKGSRVARALGLYRNYKWHTHHLRLRRLKARVTDANFTRLRLALAFVPPARRR